MNTERLKKLRKQLRTIEREVEYQLKAQSQCCGVTAAQCHVLLELAELQPANLIELSECLKLDASTLSRTVDSLVQAGYVDRITDPENRRYVQLKLTAAGKNKTESIDQACNRFYQALFAHFSKSKQSALLESVTLLAEIFAQLRNGACCPVDAAPACTTPRRKRGRRK